MLLATGATMADLLIENWGWVVGALGAIAAAGVGAIRVVWLYATGKFDSFIKWFQPKAEDAYNGHMKLVKTLQEQVETTSKFIEGTATTLVSQNTKMSSLDARFLHMIDAIYSQTLAAELLAKDDKPTLEHLQQVKLHLELARKPTN